MKKNGKTFQQICVELKGFVPQTRVCRSRKHKSDMAIASRAKDVNFACADFSCLLPLQLKNGDQKFFNSLEELERLLLEIQYFIAFPFFMHFFKCYWVDFFVSSYKKMLLAVTILRIQIQSLESVCGTLIFSEVLVKRLKFY